MPIVVTCPECEKRLRAPDAAAGKRVKCPGCGSPITVPASAPSPVTRKENGKPPARPAAPPRTAVKTTKSRPPVEDDDDEMEERPRRKSVAKAQKKSMMPLVLSLAGVIVLAGGGTAAWFLWPKTPETKQPDKNDTTTKPDTQPGPAEAVADLDMVTPDAVGFVTVQPANVWKSAAITQMTTALGKEVVGDLLKQAEDTLGIQPPDVERVTAAMVTDFRTEPLIYGIVSTSKPYDKEKIRKVGGGLLAEKNDKSGAKYDLLRGGAVHYVNDKQLVFGTEPGVQKWCQANKASQKPAGELADALKRAAGTAQFVAWGKMPPADVTAQGKKQFPPNFHPLLDAKSGLVELTLTGGLQANVEMTFPADSNAQAAEKTLADVRKMGEDALANLGKTIPGGLEGQMLQGMLNKAKQLLADVSVNREGATLKVAGKLPSEDAALLASLLPPAIQKVRGAATRTQSMNNLKQIALAMHNYNSSFGVFPPAAIHKNGKPMLSWRVAILPFIEQDALYKQFKLDEPWDSPHNIKLLDKMPRTYLDPQANTKPNETTYQVVTGPGTIFPGPTGTRITGIKDGTSNTVLAATAARPVPWTKPDDIAFNPAGNMKALFASVGGGFLVAMADGSVRMLAQSVSEATLKAALTASGGEILGRDW